MAYLVPTPYISSPPSPFMLSPPPYMLPPPPASYLAVSRANSSSYSNAYKSAVYNQTTLCSSNSSANSSANISADYIPFVMATCSAKCSASCGPNRSASCSANCSFKNLGDCIPPTRHDSSPAYNLVPDTWVSLFFFTTFSNCLTLACYGVFSILILLDVFRAIKKGATWLPAKAFSLTGVTVQIIVWWTSVSSISNKCKKQVGANESVVFHQLVLSGKVAVCVFIGYLLPAMAAPSMTTFLALGLSICVQITSELLMFQKHRYDIPWKLENLQDRPNATHASEDFTGWTSWANTANSILLVCFIVLGLILVCTILASQTIHDLLNQRTSAIFSIKEDESTTPISWNDFDDEVLSSWLVARVCQPDYVISRSVFSSAVGVVITLCVIISILSNTAHNIYFSPRDDFAPIDFGICFLLFGFIIIGWTVICWRWFAAQLYFRSHRQSWSTCLSMEDFWTRSTVELIRMYDLKRERQQFFKMQTSNSTMLSNLQTLPTRIFTKVKLHKFVHLGLMLQLTVVFFSKLCGLLSEVIIGNFVYSFRKHMTSRHQFPLPKCYEGILEVICMPGENPTDLWDANVMAFEQAKALLEKGCEKGKLSKEIDSKFSLYSQQWAENGKQLLNELQKLALSSVLKHFPSIEKQCVRITTVSLIKIFIELHMPGKEDMKADPVKNVMNICDEVWDLLRFTDECDIDLQANEISILVDLQRDKDQVGMAAETEFYELQLQYNKPTISEDCATGHVKGERTILEGLLKKCIEFLQHENLLEGDQKNMAPNLSDSKDWMEIAPTYHLYKLCRFMLDNNSAKICGSNKIEDCGGDAIEGCVGNSIEGCAVDFATWTEEALRNVIACCMSRLPDMLVNQCWKWAQEFEEDKLWEAIDLAGKCKGIMQMREPIPKLTRNAIKQRTIMSCSGIIP